MATIQGIYVALFGRPADPAGLAYFNTVTSGGADLTAIGDLASTAEYQARFAGMTNEQIINAIYQSLFERNAEPAGLQFFLNELDNGTFNINNIAIAILDGAQGADRAMADAKINAANLFTAALDSEAEIDAYVGAFAIQVGQEFLADVETDDPATTDEVNAAIQRLLDEGQVPGGGGGTGGSPASVVLYDADGDFVSRHDSVQAAEDAAGTGYTVRVNGTFAGDVNVDVADLTIEGGTNGRIHGGVYLAPTASGTTLRDLRISGTLDNPTSEGASIFVDASDVTIENTPISSSDAEAKAGIITTGSVDNLTITNNTISGFTGYGIYLNPTDDGASVTNNTFTNNRYGIMFENGEVEAITGNTFVNSSEADIGAWVTTFFPIDLGTFISGNTHSGANDGAGVQVLSTGITEVVGTSGKDEFIVFGAEGVNTLDGGDGADILFGRDANDILDGGASNAGAGEFNYLIGGAGDDDFVANHGFAGYPVGDPSGAMNAWTDGFSFVTDFGDGNDDLDMDQIVLNIFRDVHDGTGIEDINDVFALLEGFTDDVDAEGEAAVLEITGGAMVGTYVAAVTEAGVVQNFPVSGPHMGMNISVIGLVGTGYNLQVSDFAVNI